MHAYILEVASFSLIVDTLSFSYNVPDVNLKIENDTYLYSQARNNCYSWSTNHNLPCHYPMQNFSCSLSHFVDNCMPHLFPLPHSDHLIIFLVKSPSYPSTSLTNFLELIVFWPPSCQPITSISRLFSLYILELLLKLSRLACFGIIFFG